PPHKYIASKSVVLLIICLNPLIEDKFCGLRAYFPFLRSQALHLCVLPIRCFPSF
ncbi:hypothetical protein GIB67_028522, partial [Kingdonia uniflora]